jgi:hypothetical protein
VSPLPRHDVGQRLVILADAKEQLDDYADIAEPGHRRPINIDPTVNPLLDFYNDAMALPATTTQPRAEAIRKYGFAIPTDDALEHIERYSSGGVVEIGAGTGYWAHLLDRRGVDVRAFDVEPAPSSANEWFAGTQPWHRIEIADHTVVAQWPTRTLLIVWPTKNDIWASAAVKRYHDAGGSCVAFVGELSAGRTGDEVFHAHLGNVERCLQCAYGILTSPCICDIHQLWTRQTTVVLPHWHGYNDDLHIYVRLDRATARRRRFPRRAPR